MTLVDTDRLAEIAAVEFADVVVDAFVSRLNELRIIWKPMHLQPVFDTRLKAQGPRRKGQARESEIGLA